jgi:hypothetical protein
MKTHKKWVLARRRYIDAESEGARVHYARLMTDYAFLGTSTC